MDTPEKVSLAVLPVSNEAEGEMAGDVEVPAAAGGGLPRNCFFILLFNNNGSMLYCSSCRLVSRSEKNNNNYLALANLRGSLKERGA